MGFIRDAGQVLDLNHTTIPSWDGTVGPPRYGRISAPPRYVPYPSQSVNTRSHLVQSAGSNFSQLGIDIRAGAPDVSSLPPTADCSVFVSFSPLLTLRYFSTRDDDGIRVNSRLQCSVGHPQLNYQVHARAPNLLLS